MNLQNRIKAFLEKLFVTKNLPLYPEKKLSIKHRAPGPDELALGYAWGLDDKENGDIWQLKGINQEARDAHFYAVGATRSGKTKFLETLIVQDIKNGLGFGVIDPHGDLTENVKGYLYQLKGNDPEFLKEKIVLIDPADKNFTVSFNPLERNAGESPARTASELTEAFKKIWKDSWGARMEDLLRNSLIALIENDLTLAELPLFLADDEARRKILEKVNHEICRRYFARFNSLRKSTQDEWMESTLNKVNAFLFDNELREMLSSSKSSFSLRNVIDEGKILIVKLDKGRFKGNADLLGSLMLAKIQAAAFSRADLSESRRRKFYLYIDEFQNFAAESFISVLAEAAKYRLALVLAHQNLAQLPVPLRASILSNCGIQAYFRISRNDAEILAKESLTSIYANPPGWEEYIRALQELPPRICFIKNKIAGGVVAVRTLNQMPPHEQAGMNEEKFTEKIAVCNIGGKYLRKRNEIEEEYKKRVEKLTNIEEPETFKVQRRK